ncbi:sulfur carrier protein ThiS adenylyltransferase ThiF [Desulfomarina sp.]
MKTGIAGIGGIGSNVARHLVQQGLGWLKTVDFDRVETTNLNRQFYRFSQAGELKTDALEENLKEIHPELVVNKINARITADNGKAIFHDCRIIVEGFDDPGSKKNLIELFSDTEKILVCASGIAGHNMKNIAVRRIGNCHIVGDFFSDEREHPLFAPKIAMIAAIMAGIVLHHAGLNRETQ